VLYYQNCLAGFFVKLVDKLYRVFPRGGIKVCQRFIEEEHINVIDQYACYRDPLLLAAGKILGAFTKMRRHVYQMGNLSYAAMHLFRWHAVVFQGEGNVLGGAKTNKLPVCVLQNRTGNFGNVKDIQAANI